MLGHPREGGARTADRRPSHSTGLPYRGIVRTGDSDPGGGGQRRPRLGPARADVRRAVRASLSALLDEGRDAPEGHDAPEAHDPRDAHDGKALVLVALSGGPDSLALASATAFEAPRLALRAGAVIVDHGLQDGSAAVAHAAAAQAHGLGLSPVLLLRAVVDRAHPAGPEAAAREARYAALRQAAAEAGAAAVLLGHTLDDQAETVLLGLARGSGARSLAGMAPVAGRFRRPLLGLRRTATRAACAEEGLEPWHDPQNEDGAFTRARVRARVLPTLEAELGPGVAEALARTAQLLRDDADALDAWAQRELRALLSADPQEPPIAPHPEAPEPPIELPVDALAALPAPVRRRVIRAAAARLGAVLSYSHTRAAERLVTDWHGQRALDLPGARVGRAGGVLRFAASPPERRLPPPQTPEPPAET